MQNNNPAGNFTLDILQQWVSAEVLTLMAEERLVSETKEDYENIIYDKTRQFLRKNIQKKSFSP